MAPRRTARRGNTAATSQDATTPTSSLLSRLIPIFEKVQTDEDLVAGEKRIQAALEDHALAQGVVDQLRIDESDAAENSNNNPSYLEALSHVMDCTVSKGLNDCSRPVFRLLAIALTIKEHEQQDETTLLDRLIAFSGCGTEFIRSAATFLLVQWYERAVAAACDTTTTNHHVLLDTLQAAILTRYTDKAVSVRAAALVTTPDDPDVRAAVLWMVQHDPSAANRTLAATALAGSMAATDYFVQRVRDVHTSVRVAAIQTCLRAHPTEACRVLADVVEAGWTERCKETKQATGCLIRDCFKTAHFNLEELMQLMSVEEYPEAAESVVVALQSKELLEDPGDFSAAEIDAYHEGVRQGTSLVIGDDNEDISLEQLFVARVLVASLSSKQEQDYLVSKIIPDIPRACQMLEQIVDQVVQDIANDSENEERLSMTFNQLIELIVINGVQEEGSRRLFSSCMQSLIVNVVTPDVLIPHCLKALSKCARDPSFALDILDRLDEQKSSDEIKDLVILRWLTVSSNALDSVSLGVDPRPYLDHDNPCVQLAAVECLGKLGLYQAPAAADRQLVLDLAGNDGTDAPELRCHAAMVLSDWSLVTKEGMDETFRSLLSQWMQQRQTLLSVVACEIAMKQLQSKAVCDSDWICTLVIQFFDPSGDDDEDEDAARLQQLLALFFPTMVRIDRDAVIGCVQALLDRNRKLSAVKMVQYIVQTASEATATEESSSAELMAAVQIASFLSETSSDITKTLVRSLCKMMDGWEWDIEKELYEHLSVLKELLDELLNNDVIEDKTSLAHLQTCYARLDDVEMEDQVNDDDDDDDDETVDDDITQAMVKLDLTESTNVENSVTQSAGKEEARGERRHSRRLRPSN